MKRPIYLAGKSFTVGDREVATGDPVPEANDWLHVQNWINQGYLVLSGYEDEVTTEEEVAEPGDEYEDLTVPELREIAKEQGRTGYSKLPREDLLELLATDPPDDEDESGSDDESDSEATG